MDCSIVQHNLFDYMENKLSPDIRRDFEAHLSVCHSCTQIFTALQSMETAIEKSKKTETDPFIETRIIQRIENELTKHKNKRILSFRPILVTLTLICAIAMGFAIGKINSDRMKGSVEVQNQIENLKTELFIHDFIDENKTLLVNK
jgi:predicted anti-sigma-YlaC factor YlaD